MNEATLNLFFYSLAYNMICINEFCEMNVS